MTDGLADAECRVIRLAFVLFRRVVVRDDAGPACGQDQTPERLPTVTQEHGRRCQQCKTTYWNISSQQQLNSSATVPSEDENTSRPFTALWCYDVRLG